MTANHPVEAANDGLVMLAKYFGIYGNTVILDHGCGLMTLYAHLSSIDVKEADEGHEGARRSGTAERPGSPEGDHLHFSVLVEGVSVNPVEWWDPHWIHDRIETKLGARSVALVGRSPRSSRCGRGAESQPLLSEHQRQTSQEGAGWGGSHEDHAGAERP